MRRINKITVIIIGLLIIFGGEVRAADDFDQKFEIYLQALGLVQNEYVDKKLDSTKLVYGSVKGLLESLGDPYTRFIEPKAYKEFIKAEKTAFAKTIDYKMIRQEVAYLGLPTFDLEKVPQDFTAALERAKKANAQGLIIDLRGNGGGMFSNAIKIGDMFINKGNLVVQIIDREGKKGRIFSKGEIRWDKPVVVLIDQDTASASEVLAAALKANKVAKIVGTQSFGKAVVQGTRFLTDGSVIMITIEKYLTPNGEDINKKGVAPDYVVDISTEEAAIMKWGNPDKDKQLKKALDVLMGINRQ